LALQWRDAMAIVKMLKFLRPSCVALRLKATTKEEAIQELLDLLERENLLDDPGCVREDVMVRERQMSTGMTDGLAIPHAKSSGVKELVIALGLKPEGIEFQSLDGEPARVVFMVVSPIDRTGPHLQCLAEITSFYSRPGERQELLAARNVQEVLTKLGVV